MDDLRRTVEAGLPVAALDYAAGHVAGEGAAATELKHRIVPKTTLHRRGDRLSLEESQRLERLARMVAMAEDVWEDVELAHEFLLSAQPQLGGERPIDLARSELGARQVEMVLFALEHALPSDGHRLARLQEAPRALRWHGRPPVVRSTKSTAGNLHRLPAAGAQE